MTAALLPGTAARPPLAPHPQAVPRTAGLLALSPRLVLLALPDFAGTGRIVEAVLTGPAGQLEPPLSWQSLTLPEGRIHVLLTRMQPGLVPNAALQLSAAGGLTIRLTLEAAEDTEALLGSAEPGVLLALLRFLVAKALGAIRAAGDAELAQFCRRLAAAASATARTAQAVARCGRDALAWSLPGDAVPGVHILLAPHRMHRMVLADGPAILPDCGAHEAWLLPPGGGTLIHLPAPPRLPSLGQLGRGKDLRGRALHRAAQAELARRAAVEPAMQRLLRDQQLLQPTLPMHRHAAPDFPLGASLDLAVPDQAGGLFLRGWLRDPLGLVGSLTLVGPYGEQRLAPAALQRFPRPDLVKEFATAPHGGADCQAGFALHLPEGAARPAAQFRLRLGLTTGDEMTLVAPPGLLHPQAARDAILGAIAPAHATAALMARAIAPPVERLHALVMAGRGAPEVIRMGDAPRAPIASLVVPLYRNLRFLRHQLGAFARDPALREAELIYVLDSPEQRDEVEQMLRGMHRLYRLPLVLVVQPRNHGYGAACHAGVAEAGAPVLLLLNSDVVPATRNWLAPMLTALKRQRKLAAVGPKLLFEDGSLQHAGLYFLQMDGEAEWFNDHYFKGHPRHWPAAQVARRVPGITGATFCVRAEAWKAVGGISTDYVIGDYEDSDLCLRLRAAGGEIGYIPQSELFHFERQSIRDHGGYARSLASTYNRTLHHRRWAPEIAALMARQARAERR